VSEEQQVTVNREHRSPTEAEWPVLEELREHIYQYWLAGPGGKPGDPGWHPCRCGWEGYWSAWQPHVAQALVEKLGPGLGVSGDD